MRTTLNIEDGLIKKVSKLTGIKEKTALVKLICAPIYSTHDGLSTQVRVGLDEGLKHDSSIHCDELISLPKSVPTNFVGSLSLRRIEELNSALSIALDIRYLKG